MANQKVGYLRSCMDRRFLASTRRAFEQETGLAETEYFHEAFAGGTLGTPPGVNGADYVYNRAFNDPNGGIDLVVMGWQVHLEHCGGLPDQSNATILAAFQSLITSGTLQTKYPNVKHLFFVQPTMMLNFSNLGDYIAWCNVNYTDVFGQPCRWQSDRFGQRVRSIEIPAGASGLSISGGSIGNQGEVGQAMQITNATIPDAVLSAGGTKTYYFTGTFSVPVGSDTRI